MKRLTEQELIALCGVLKLECMGLAMARTIKTLIDDDDMYKLYCAGILEQEGRINAIKKFVNENVANECGGCL